MEQEYSIGIYPGDVYNAKEIWNKNNLKYKEDDSNKDEVTFIFKNKQDKDKAFKLVNTGDIIIYEQTTIPLSEGDDLQGHYSSIQKKLPKLIQVFCNDVNKKFGGDLDYIIYRKKENRVCFSLDGYTNSGMNEMIRIVKNLCKDSKYNKLFKYNKEESDEDAEVDILEPKKLKETTITISKLKTLIRESIQSILKEDSNLVKDAKKFGIEFTPNSKGIRGKTIGPEQLKRIKTICNQLKSSSPDKIDDMVANMNQNMTNKQIAYAYVKLGMYDLMKNTYSVKQALKVKKQ